MDTDSTAPPAVRLREAVGEDSPFLVEMLGAAANWSPEREQVSRVHLLADRATARYVEGWPRTGDLGLIAETAQQEPVGAAWLRLFPAEDAGYGFVGPDVPELSLGVVPPWRGRGVGRALLRGLRGLAREAGHQELSLSVERANRARELYLSEGFTTVRADGDADTMALSLHSDFQRPARAPRAVRPTPATQGGCGGPETPRFRRR
ncbi:GNAT family N-acetyltransferase [Streptomyces tardus]|uniref:GNAT family N-acetyltransferase n=1 Tax=Streptomyces tardus TaxID=2780544 RepID=UPI0027E45B11|nr:GNAT family N-acetyltransferase [Streptomyces tardus]